jgi:protein phosphatase
MKEWNQNEVLNKQVNLHFGNSTLAFQGNTGIETFKNISSHVDLRSIIEKCESRVSMLKTLPFPSDEQYMMPDNIVAMTDVGLVRSLNEDNWTCKTLSSTVELIAVADGMGGHDRGEVASEKAVTILASEANSMLAGRNEVSLDELQKIMVTSFQAANNGIQEYAATQKSDMGTTLVTALVYNNQMALIANVGDSRGYLFRNGELHLMTKDHSWVQRMVDQNQLTQEEARHHPHSNILMRTVGTDRDVRIDVFPIEMQSGDVILLCSDGLWGEVEDQYLKDVLETTYELKSCAQQMVNLAKKNGGKDNITHVLYRIP